MLLSSPSGTGSSYPTWPGMMSWSNGGTSSIFSGPLLPNMAPQMGLRSLSTSLAKNSDTVRTTKNRKGTSALRRLRRAIKSNCAGAPV